MKVTIILLTYFLASCAGSFRILPDGSVVIEPDPIIITPDK